MTDESIIARCQKGDSPAFELIVLRYQNKVLNLCRYLLKNPHDAEDAAQETFIKSFKNICRYTPDAAFYTWLSRIAVNTCTDFQRKRALFSLFFSDDDQDQIELHPTYAPDPEMAYEAQQSMQALQAALKQLSIKLRTVIVLKELEGLSYEEIAGILDVSTGTVKSRVSRAREELAKNIKKTTEQNRF